MAVRRGGSPKTKTSTKTSTKTGAAKPKAAVKAGVKGGSPVGGRAKSKSKSKSSAAPASGPVVDGDAYNPANGAGDELKDPNGDSGDSAYQSGSMLCRANSGVRAMKWDGRSLLHVSAGALVLGWEIDSDKLIHTINPTSKLVPNTAAAATTGSGGGSAADSKAPLHSVSVTCIDVRLDVESDFTAAPGTGVAIMTIPTAKSLAAARREAAAAEAARLAAKQQQTAAQSADIASRASEEARRFGATDAQVALLSMLAMGGSIEGLDGAADAYEFKARMEKAKADGALADADAGGDEKHSATRPPGISDYVLIGLSTGECCVYDVQTLECVRQWTAHTPLVTVPAAAGANGSGVDPHAGHTAVSASGAGNVYASVNAVALSMVPPFIVAADGNSSGAAESKSHLFAYSVGSDGYFRARDLNTERTIHSYSQCSCPLTTLVVNPSNPSMVVVGGVDGRVRILDCRAMTVVMTLSAHASGEPVSPIRVLAFAPIPVAPPAAKKPDEKKAAGSSAFGVWRPQQPVKKVKKQVVLPSSLYILLCAHGNGGLVGWDLRNGSVYREFVPHSDAINTITIHGSPNAPSSVTERPPPPTNGSSAAAINAAAQQWVQPLRVYTGSDDHRMNVYDLRTGALLDTLIGHSHGVTALAVVTTNSAAAAAAAAAPSPVITGNSNTARAAAAAAAAAAASSAAAAAALATELVSASYDCTLRTYKLNSVAVAIQNRALKKLADDAIAAHEWVLEKQRMERRRIRARKAKRSAKAKAVNPDKALMQSLGLGNVNMSATSTSSGRTVPPGSAQPAAAAAAASSNSAATASVQPAAATNPPPAAAAS